LLTSVGKRERDIVLIISVRLFVRHVEVLYLNEGTIAHIVKPVGPSGRIPGYFEPIRRYKIPREPLSVGIEYTGCMNYLTNFDRNRSLFRKRLYEIVTMEHYKS